MKKTLSLILALATLAISPVLAHAQTQTPQPTSNVWAVTGEGCPASSALPAALASQWTAALAAVSGNAAETAQVQAQQAYINARIAAILTANPQQDIQVRVVRPLYSSPTPIQIIFIAKKLPSGATCPTS